MRISRKETFVNLDTLEYQKHYRRLLYYAILPVQRNDLFIRRRWEKNGRYRPEKRTSFHK